MNPTIGRIVHYRTGGTDDEPELVAAIIVAVHSPTCVNLRLVCDDDEHLPHSTSACEGDGLYEWRWPARI